MQDFVHQPHLLVRQRGGGGYCAETSSVVSHDVKSGLKPLAYALHIPCFDTKVPDPAPPELHQDAARLPKQRSDLDQKVQCCSLNCPEGPHTTHFAFFSKDHPNHGF